MLASIPHGECTKVECDASRLERDTRQGKIEGHWPSEKPGLG